MNFKSRISTHIPGLGFEPEMRRRTRAVKSNALLRSFGNNVRTVSSQPLGCRWLIWPIQNNAKNQQKLKMIEILADGYSSENTQQELSNEYQHDRVSLVFRNLCVLDRWKKVASAFEGGKRNVKFSTTYLIFDSF